MNDLIEALNEQRQHIFAAIDGLTEEQLARPVLPSGWSCLGMLKHLALADEHYLGSDVDRLYPYTLAA